MVLGERTSSYELVLECNEGFMTTEESKIKVTKKISYQTFSFFLEFSLNFTFILLSKRET